MSDLGALTRSLANEDKRVDRALKKYRKDLISPVSGLVDYVRSNRRSDGILGITPTTQSVTDLLNRLGLQSMFDSLPDLLAEVGAGAAETVSVVGEADIIGSRAILAAAQSSFETVSVQLGRTTAILAETIRQEMIAATILPRSLKASAAVFQTAFGIAQAQALTIANTALAQVQRTVHLGTLESFDEGDAFVLYEGPNDKVIRPFCEALQGKAIRKSDLGSLDNGQGLTVALHGGGWNCRHTLVPVSSAFIEANGIEVVGPAEIASANSAGSQRSRRSER